jgi:hypothetical protein
MSSSFHSPKYLQSLPGYDQLLTVSQVAEDALRGVTVADIKTAPVLRRVG